MLVVDVCAYIADEFALGYAHYPGQRVLNLDGVDGKRAKKCMHSVALLIAPWGPATGVEIISSATPQTLEN